MRVTNIKKEFKTTGLVESDSQPGAFYKVVFENGKITCTCPNNTKAGKECKHIQAFREELEYRKEMREQDNQNAN